MGFYIQALREDEEFMGNTGFDDNLIGQPGGEYAAELDDIAQTIKDVNDDYADQAEQEELDGQDLAEDPVEECAMALYESEYNWNQIFMALGRKELHEAATGKSSVLTENAVTDFFKKIKEFFVKLFKKIAAFFKNWLDNALTVFRTNDSFLKKYGSQLDKGKEAFDESGKSIKGYNFNTGTMNTFAKAVETELTNSKSTIKALTNAFKEKGINPNIKNFSDIVNTYDPDTYRARLVGKSNTEKVNSSDFRDELKTHLFGSIDKEEVSDDNRKPEHIKNILKNGKKNIEDSKKLFKKINDSFKAAINNCDTLERAVNSIKASEDVDTKDYANTKSVSKAAKTVCMKNASKLLTNMKEIKGDVSKAFSMCLKAMKGELSQARKIGNAYILSLNKKTRKDKIEKLESTSFLSNIEMI